MNKVYLCIDLKTFFASCECVERGLDPFKTNLVVADPSRGDGAICLAVSPRMKELGIHNRCRIFEIPKDVEYITALPRMRLYIDYASRIYSIYLRYIAKEDIHPYSIDEMFLDVTNYLKMHKMSDREFAKFLLSKIYNELGLTATVGIGTNLFLAKIALDINAKHNKDNIGYLDEKLFKETLWEHRPLTDFWQISKGIERRLNKLGAYCLKDVTLLEEDRLYKEFGINAEILIDHANGVEPVTIKDIQSYKRKSQSISQSQILFEDYSFEKARIVLTEMVELLSLKLVDAHLVSNNISLRIGYSKDVRAPSGGSLTISNTTNVYTILLQDFLKLYDATTSRKHLIRSVAIGFNNVKDENYEYLDLFTDVSSVTSERELEKTINSIKQKFGKNAILKGVNLLDGATTRKRNKLIGGHNSGDE